MTRWSHIGVGAKALLMAAAVAAASGCVTAAGDGKGGDVVERSKEQAPAWCALDKRKFHEAGDSLRYVDEGHGLLDLPLGIKQTQLTALEGSRTALAVAAAARARAFASDAGVTLGANAMELERAVTEAAAEVHARHARVTDIYFEKRLTERTETYGVQILIQLPRSGMDELHRDVARRLSQSRDVELRRVGAAMTTAAAGSYFSH